MLLYASLDHSITKSKGLPGFMDPSGQQIWWPSGLSHQILRSKGRGDALVEDSASP